MATRQLAPGYGGAAGAPCPAAAAPSGYPVHRDCCEGETEGPLCFLPRKSPWIAKAWRSPPTTAEKRGLEAEMQFDESASADRLDRACLSNVGRDRCSRAWVEEGSFPAVFEARWPWHLVGACLAGRSLISLCSHLCFLSLFPPSSPPPLAAARRIREQRPQTGTYRHPHRPVAQER